MDVREALEQFRGSLGAKRVFGKPVRSDGLTVIPAARISGGAGGGGGERPDGQGRGSGAGFGIHAKPVGAFVIKNGTVRWKPAIDLVHLGIAAVLVLLCIRSIVKILSRP